MELQILDSILNKELRPWKMEENRKTRMMDAFIQAQNIPAETLSDLNRVQKLMVAPFPELGKNLCLKCIREDHPLVRLPLYCELAGYEDGYGQYYQVVIDNECQRIYNKFLWIPSGSEKVAARAAELLLKKTRKLAAGVSQKIKRMQKDKQYSDLDYFVLNHLKCQLIILYFSLQQLFNNYLEVRVSLEIFYLHVLGEKLDDICEIKRTEAIQPSKSKKQPVKKQDLGTSLLSFGFHGNQKKLKTVIYKLCKELEVLDENKCSVDDFIEVLSSKGFVPGSKIIYLHCYTSVFSYIIDRLKNWFEDLTYVNIGESKSFISRTKDIITRTALSSARSKTPVNPKKAQLIDVILKELHGK